MKPDGPAEGSMEAQLIALYRDQQLLRQALGTAEPRELIALVEGLNAQLRAVYAAQDQAGEALPRSEQTP